MAERLFKRSVLANIWQFDQELLARYQRIERCLEEMFYQIVGRAGVLAGLPK